ncbi:MAG: hypothetical protein PHG96_08345, partial [Kiritimatiellae bacterium]|nr:hypothetical protein [Kiritimatiellia bacterium]
MSIATSFSVPVITGKSQVFPRNVREAVSLCDIVVPHLKRQLQYQCMALDVKCADGALNLKRAVDSDTDTPQVWRTDLECGGKRYSARRRFGADRPESGAATRA